MDFHGPKDLKVWQKSIEMVVQCYRLTRKLPDSERFGLKTQIERAAVSVPANIAEGHGLGYKKSFIHHLWIANGSLAELQTHFVIAGRLGFFSQEETRGLFLVLDEIGRMISGLRNSLER
jgi:four helix bundle protein